MGAEEAEEVVGLSSSLPLSVCLSVVGGWWLVVGGWWWLVVVGGRWFGEKHVRERVAQMKWEREKGLDCKAKCKCKAPHDS